MRVSLIAGWGRGGASFQPFALISVQILAPGSSKCLPGNAFGRGVRVRWNLSCVAFSPTVEGPWRGEDVTLLLHLKHLDGLR